jgi:hypothetical protein
MLYEFCPEFHVHRKIAGEHPENRSAERFSGDCQTTFL